MRGLMSYWYHFAIMFEALFILTTIDTGTRVSRFLLQEFLGRAWKPFARVEWVPGTILSTLAIVSAWSYFILTGSISTIWPMFGIANQLLAVIALAIGTTLLLNAGRGRAVWVTAAPMAFVATTTLTAGFLSVRDNFLPLARSADPAKASQGVVDALLTSIMMGCVVLILIEAVLAWRRAPATRAARLELGGGPALAATGGGPAPPASPCC
jgi:carbon starvation protein